MDYTTTAPIISGVGIDEEIATAFITEKIIDDNTPIPDPEITKLQVKEIGKIFKEGTISQNNGVVAIAQNLGLTTQQVKAIFKELVALENVIKSELENVDE